MDERARVYRSRFRFPQRKHELNSLDSLRTRIDAWCRELGFAANRVTDIALEPHVARLREWLDAGHHGEMAYMAEQLPVRADPSRLLRGVRRAIVVRMDYLHDAEGARAVLADATRGYVSRYALGRDYHKVMRPRLGRLANLIKRDAAAGGFRGCVDSAPVFEKALAERAGLGWFGKNTLILDRDAGSWFFLGVLLTDLPLPIDTRDDGPGEPPDEASPAVQRGHCGSCTACLDVCPTKAFVGPRQLDARRCISYLTIEFEGVIPEDLRPAIGNRIFGCDDCQLVCPWNRYARVPQVPDFAARNGLDGSALTTLFGWSEEEFEANSLGSPLRRIGHVLWLRNVAVALGNAPPSAEVLAALAARSTHPSALVREHVAWALERQRAGLARAAQP
jgi:epoxyqueuosine reductase